MPKKSKYDLKGAMLCPVPLFIIERLFVAYPDKNWTEAAREILELATADFPMKEEEE